MSGIANIPYSSVIIAPTAQELMEEGFESWNDKGWDITGGGITDPTAARRTGSRGLRIDSSGSGDRDFIAKTMTEKDEVTVIFYIRFNTLTLGTGDNTYVFWMESDNGALVKICAYRTVGGQYRWHYYGIGDGDITTTAITTDVWYCIKVYWKDGVADGRVKIWLNDELLVDETGESSNEANANRYYFGQILAITSGDTIQVDFDDIYISGDLWEIYKETILGINLHLGCTSEVSGYEVIVDRGNPDYDNLIDPGETNALTNGEEIRINLGRGTNRPRLLTGKLEEIEYEDEVEEFEFRNIARIRGRCMGYKLFSRKYDGDLISDVGTGYQNYNRTSGDAASLVAYLIDNYTSLGHSRVEEALTGDAASAQKVVAVADGTTFAVGNLVKIIDDNAWEYNRIGSISTNNLTMENNLVNAYTTAANAEVKRDLICHSDTTYTQMIYTRTTVYEIIKFIAATADLSGTIGYDFRIEYDELFAFLPLNSQAESYSLQDECQFNRYLKDALRVKNKITVLGKADKPYPLDTDGQPWSDALTETYSQNLSEVKANVASAQKEVEITEGEAAANGYQVGDYMWLTDSASIGEQCQIASITPGSGSNDILTMEANIGAAYTTANHAIIWEVTAASKGWGYLPQGAWNDFNVGLDAVTYHTGAKSIGVTFNNAKSYAHIFLVLEEGEEVDMDLFKNIRKLFYFDTTAPSYVQIKLFSGGCSGTTEYAVSQPIRGFQADEWISSEVSGGTPNEFNWIMASA